MKTFDLTKLEKSHARLGDEKAMTLMQQANQLKAQADEVRAAAQASFEAVRAEIETAVRERLALEPGSAVTLLPVNGPLTSVSVAPPEDKPAVRILAEAPVTPTV